MAIELAMLPARLLGAGASRVVRPRLVGSSMARCPSQLRRLTIRYSPPVSKIMQGEQPRSAPRLEREPRSRSSHQTPKDIGTSGTQDSLHELTQSPTAGPVVSSMEAFDALASRGEATTEHISSYLHRARERIEQLPFTQLS